MKRCIAAAVLAAAFAAAPAAAQGYGYGELCANQSRAKAPGESRSAFAQCVVAVARAVASEETSAREACRTMSRIRDANGRSPYVKCVIAARRLERELG